ncbi:glycosyltransferase family 2 protein [Magnetococcales bacterium HHB-1]
MEKMIDSSQGISFIVPAYNEELGIHETLTHLEETLKKLPIPSEIIVVDDGSKDKTAEIVRTFPNVTLIAHPINIGYGNALKTGVSHARFERIGMIDGDGTYPVERIPYLLEKMDLGFDMVVGERQGTEEHDTFFKRIARWIFVAIASMLSGKRIPDPNSGLRLVKRNMIFEFWEFLCGTFSFTTGLTVISLEKPYFVGFFPIEYGARKGKSKVRHLIDSTRAIQLIIQGIAYYNPFKIIMLIAGFMVLGVGFPAMLLAMMDVLTLSLYYLIVACTFSIIFALGILSYVVRISARKHRKESRRRGVVRHQGAILNQALFKEEDQT